MSAWKFTVREFLDRFSVFKKSQSIDSVDSFQEFLATRAAFVSQKKLYEYIKTRMGMNYPKAFQDDFFIESLNIAKWHVYAACMSDLAVWMCAQTYKQTGNREETVEIAEHVFSGTLHDRFEAEVVEKHAGEILEEFGNRLALIDWNAKSQDDSAFSLSPKELVRWAPIAPELKKYDVEIVENSIRFSWVSKRQEFLEVYNHEAFIEDWRRQYPAI
ncbi:MAG: hypothetical protein ACR2O0_07730 [Rhizobiaceae bacterium]